MVRRLMDIQEFNPTNHYEMVSEWWKGHKWPVLPLDLLPVDGLIIEDTCAAWIYFSNTPVAWLGWPVGNPATPGKPVYEGLELIINHMRLLAKQRGAKVIMGFAKHKGLLALYEKLGCEFGDVDTTQIIFKVE